MAQALTIDVEARFAQVMDGLDALNAKSSRTVQQMDSAFAGLKGTLAGLAGAFTVGALTDRFTTAVSSLAALDDAAQTTGASVESLSSILNTLAPTGVTLEQISDATGKLVKAMQGADEETKGAGAAFAALGIATRDAAGNLRATDQVLTEIAQAFAKYEDGANKVVLAQALFGKSGAALIPMLGDLADKQKAAGTVTAEQAKAAADLEDSWRKLRQQSELLAQSIASTIIPNLQKLLDQFTKGIEVAGGFFAALGKFGLSNPWKSPTDQIASLSDELTKQGEIIKRNQALIDGSAASFGRGARGAAQGRVDDANKRIDEINREIQYWRLLEEQQGKVTNLKSGALYGDNTPAKTAAPSIPGGSSAAKAAGIDKAELTDAQKAIVDAFKQIEGVQQRAAQAAATLELLDQMFFQGSLSAKQYDDITKAIFKTSETSGDSIVAANEKAAQGWRDLIDPAEKYRRQLEEIQKLRDAPGGLTGEQADAAAAKVIEQISSLSEFAKVMDKSASSMKDLNDEGAKFGKIMESAFENAILRGQSLSGVLKGLAQDIARVWLRDNVTNPIASGAGGFLASLFGGPRGNATPAAANGTFLGEGDMVFGKSVRGVAVSAGITVAPVINIDSRSDQAQIRQQVEGAVAKSIAMANDMRARGSIPA